MAQHNKWQKDEKFFSQAETPNKKKEKYIEDLNNFFLLSKSLRCQYNKVLVVSDTGYLGIVNSIQDSMPQIAVKVFLVTMLK